jgi:hypothetical protein
MILQLNPPIPVNTPKGSGLAWLLIDYGPEHDLMWTVAIDDTGELWTYGNPQVRAQKNITLERLQAVTEHKKYYGN